jgi:hypothetical protein
MQPYIPIVFKVTHATVKNKSIGNNLAIFVRSRVHERAVRAIHTCIPIV